jgi:hypothetical protein
MPLVAASTKPLGAIVGEHVCTAPEDDDKAEATEHKEEVDALSSFLTGDLRSSVDNKC